jgi:hypothetical protein
MSLEPTLLGAIRSSCDSMWVAGSGCPSICGNHSEMGGIVPAFSPHSAATCGDWGAFWTGVSPSHFNLDCPALSAYAGSWCCEGYCKDHDDTLAQLSDGEIADCATAKANGLCDDANIANVCCASCGDSGTHHGGNSDNHDGNDNHAEFYPCHDPTANCQCTKHKVDVYGDCGGPPGCYVASSQEQCEHDGDWWLPGGPYNPPDNHDDDEPGYCDGLCSAFETECGPAVWDTTRAECTPEYGGNGGGDGSARCEPRCDEESDAYAFDRGVCAAEIKQCAECLPATCHACINCHATTLGVMLDGAPCEDDDARAAAESENLLSSCAHGAAFSPADARFASLTLGHVATAWLKPGNLCDPADAAMVGVPEGWFNAVCCATCAKPHDGR